MHDSGDGDLAVPSPYDDTKGEPLHAGKRSKFIKADDTGGGVCWAVGRGVLDDFCEYALAVSREVERSRRTTYYCGSSLCVDR
jgi:hypothetical protein